MTLFRQKLPASFVIGKYRLYAVLRPVLGALCLVGALFFPVVLFAVLALLWLFATARHVRLQCELFGLFYDSLTGEGTGG